MKPWMNAIDKLRSLEYSVMLDGEKLRYAYQGKGNPPREKIASLLGILKTHKDEILGDRYFLIEQTLEEINRGWQPGTLEWVKANRPEAWMQIRAIEEEMNGAVFCRDSERLREALSQYLEIWGRTNQFRLEGIRE